MSDEIIEQQNDTTEETVIDDGERRPYDDLLKENSSLRREAASRRVKNKELDDELKEFRRWKDSQMTELERAQLRVQELEKESASFRRESTQRAVAKSVQLDADLAEYIQGDSEEDMLESAKKLVAKFGTADSDSGASRSARLYGGNRGTSVGKDGSSDKNALFREYLARRTVA